MDIISHKANFFALFERLLASGERQNLKPCGIVGLVVSIERSKYLLKAISKSLKDSFFAYKSLRVNQSKSSALSSYSIEFSSSTL